MSLHELELAEKVSDKILCVNGRYVDRFGKPEEIFVPGYIAELFSLSSGSYDEINGNMELPAIKGDAEVFVICRRRNRQEYIPQAAAEWDTICDRNPFSKRLRLSGGKGTGHRGDLCRIF